MGQYLFISGCLVAVLHLIGFTSAEVLVPVLGFFAANRTMLLASGFLGAFALVCASLLFGGVGFFNILYVMAKAAFELVQLLFCAMGVSALIFWFDLGGDFWLEGGGVLAIILYAWLYGAAFSLRIFDFNFPVKDALLAYSALPFVCMAVVWASGLIR